MSHEQLKNPYEPIGGASRESPRGELQVDELHQVRFSLALVAGMLQPAIAFFAHGRVSSQIEQHELEIGWFSRFILSPLIPPLFWSLLTLTIYFAVREGSRRTANTWNSIYLACLITYMVAYHTQLALVYSSIGR
jgi:hypothetical protein